MDLQDCELPKCLHAGQDRAFPDFDPVRAARIIASIGSCIFAQNRVWVAMAKLTVHGGDFRRGDGWFYPGGQLVLRNDDGKSESIPLARVEIAEQASKASLRIYGGDEVLHADFERAITESETGERLLIACLDDGRLLLASTDQQSFEEICAPHPLETC